MKTIIGIILLLALGWFVFAWWTPGTLTTPTENQLQNEVTDQEDQGTDTERSVVTNGNYAVQPDESEFRWAGKKPLISGYINSGSFRVTEGNIAVDGETATGSFTIDMNTLSVSETPTKPGQESALEGHLKGERWFDVETHPTASFEITNVAPRSDSDTTFTYDVTGNLTMKGQTHELAFPATIYQDADGQVHAAADLEFDRTKWGITAGSGSFFDNLADNVVDDMVALSFHLIAE